MNIPVVSQLDNDDQSILSDIDNGANNNHHNDGDVPAAVFGAAMVTQQDLVVDGDEDGDEDDEEEEEDLQFDDNGGDDDVDDDEDAVDVDVDVDGGGLGVDDNGEDASNENQAPVVVEKKKMDLKWKKGLDKKEKKTGIKVKAHVRSPKNSASKTTKKKKQSLITFPVDRSPDRAMAVSLHYEQQRYYVRNFMSIQKQQAEE